MILFCTENKGLFNLFQLCFWVKVIYGKNEIYYKNFKYLFTLIFLGIIYLDMQYTECKPR